MRVVVAAVLVLGCAVSLQADDLQPQAALEGIQNAAADTAEDPQALVEALGRAHQAIPPCHDEPEATRVACRALLQEARRHATARTEAVRRAGWRLVLGLLAAPALLDTESALWLLEEAESGWSDDAAEQMTAALALSAGRLFVESEDARDQRRASQASGKLLRSKQPPLAVAAALALAGVPQEAARKLLARSLKKGRDFEEADLRRIVEALGVGGGESAVPLLIGSLEDSPAPVLEATLVALFGLSADALRPHAHDILDETMKITEREYRERLALTGKSRLNGRQQAALDRLADRAQAWSTDRLVDDPPLELPSGARGVIGVTALWWKLIDASEDRITPPEAPKDAFPRFLNGRPHIDGRAWFTWWRSAR